jgi:anti-sigma factor RsiW
MTDEQLSRNIDLIAYVDGLADADPKLKAQIEARLAGSTDDAERARAYKAQNEALRRAFGWRASEPVPERLTAVLDRPDKPSSRTAFRIAAVVALVALASTGGWLLGRGEAGGDWTPEAFLASTYEDFVTLGDAASSASATGRAPFEWLADQVSISIRVPDLEPLGYRLVDTRQVIDSGPQAVRLVYAAEDGRSFNLFLRPRWKEHRREMQVTTEGDVSLAYWLEGPLVSAVASHLPAEETRQIAETVRGALLDPHTSQMTFKATEPHRGGPVLHGGMAIADHALPVIDEPAVPRAAGQIVPN